MSKPALAIAVAPNGARLTKADHPALPVTASEIARAAAECAEAGASILHLHIRDKQGRHLLDADAYRETIAAIRREAGAELVIQITTEAVGKYRKEEQMAVVRELRPPAVSVAINEFCPSAEDEPDMERFCKWMRENTVAAQYILYSEAEVFRFNSLRKHGRIPDDAPRVLYVLGRYATTGQSAPSDLLPFLQAAANENHVWWVCAFGRREAACALAATALDGHVRVGFENNTHAIDGSIASSNAVLVEQVVQGIAMTGRSVATPDEARALLGM